MEESMYVYGEGSELKEPVYIHPPSSTHSLLHTFPPPHTALCAYEFARMLQIRVDGELCEGGGGCVQREGNG